MGTTYSITVHNDSEVSPPLFHIFAVLPDIPSIPDGGASLAWLTKRINKGNKNTFVWQLDYGFAWSAQGIENGVAWSSSESHPLPADPTLDNKCVATFDHRGASEGDFELSYDRKQPAQGRDMLWINDTSNVPPPSMQPSSVAISIDGKVAAAVAAGPRLHHTFTLHPTYYISCSYMKPGTMIDVSTSTDLFKLEFVGTQEIQVVLDDNNNWVQIHSEALLTL